MNLRIIRKNHAADSKIGSPLKIDFRADWTDEYIPTAWELNHSLIGIYKKYVKDLINDFIFVTNVRRFYNQWGWHEQKVNFHNAC